MYLYSTYLLYINLVYQYVCVYYICTYNTVYIQEVHTHDCILELGFKSNDMNMMEVFSTTVGLVLNNPTPTPMFQSVSADAQKVSSAKPVIR